MDASAAFDVALTAIDALDRLCCDPGRSPRMATLRKTVLDARVSVGSPDVLGELLEDAGAQVGRLQVGCCAPGRLPLYAEVLESLTRARLAAGPDMHT